MPTIICFCDGIAIDRIVGFEELGGQDEFPTVILARRLCNTGVMKAKNRLERGEMKMTKSKNARRDASDSD